MKHFKERREVKCEACGHVGIIVGECASACEKCGESVDPKTGKSFGCKVNGIGGIHFFNDNAV